MYYIWGSLKWRLPRASLRVSVVWHTDDTFQKKTPGHPNAYIFEVTSDALANLDTATDHFIWMTNTCCCFSASTSFNRPTQNQLPRRDQVTKQKHSHLAQCKKQNTNKSQTQLLQLQAQNRTKQPTSTKSDKQTLSNELLQSNPPETTDKCNNIQHNHALFITLHTSLQYHFEFDRKIMSWHMHAKHNVMLTSDCTRTKKETMQNAYESSQTTSCQ